MFAARRVITPLASRPMTYRLPSQLARRSFADESKPTKPAEGKSMQNNTALSIATVAAIGFIGVYVFFLSKPEKVGAAATGDKSKEEKPKHSQIK